MRAVELELLLVRTSGWLAAVLLLLAIAPLGKWRRTLGLCALAAALFHFASGLATPLVADLELLVYEPHHRAGATALLILIFMGATSFPRVVQRAGIRQWKPLHRAVYLAALLILHHVLLSPHAQKGAVIALAGAIALLIAVRLIRRLALRSPGAARPETGAE